MATATVGRTKVKRLNRDELGVAERVLRKKYRHIVPGTLKNLSANGLHHGKRTVVVTCAANKCENDRKIATSDLAQVRYCIECTTERRAARRRKPKPR